MKKFNKNIFKMLLLLAVGNSSHMILTMEEDNYDEEYEFFHVSMPSYQQSDLDATADIDSDNDSVSSEHSDSSYVFEKVYYNPHQLDVSSYEIDNDQEDESPFVEGIAYTSPDTFVLTEVVKLDEQSIPVDFYSSEHKRKTAAHNIIQGILARLEATDRDLNQTEHQLDSLEKASHKDVTMQEKSLQLIEQDIDEATDELAAVASNIRVLAHSTDKSVKGQFDKAQGTITRSHNKAVNDLEKVRKKLQNQSKKINRKIKKTLKIK
ncbi:hypothetical protein [Candidatus Chromulinivorax destructor]|uniref:t-SNARE coiled-coil homology domain-containing protein n=1 Tax=Candidatus Chromulinivorax destructor TaxID=2066483 RepID=A0A345ZBN6_9BACT|nr:hypothetical protein [Candidatus Chromulinivorax destructor]AXK60703.1 hypothetical protein C0J27_03025 [Candidatus Chromulinivorax destructor]